MNDATEALSPVAKKFVLQWGEMGSHWGINRTVAQIHALLYLAKEPLDAGAISEMLGVARSNTSTSLRELQNWGVVRTVPSLSDRRDRFEAILDPWEMFSIIMRARKAREIDPTLRIVRECAAEVAHSAAPADAHLRDRIGTMLSAFETVDELLEESLSLPPSALRGAMKLRGKLLSIFKPRERAKGA